MKSMLDIWTVAIMATIIIAGCFPYKAPLATAEGSVVEQSLLGDWNEIDSVGHRTPASMSIYRFNDHEYYVEVRYADEQGKHDTIRMRGYTTTVGDVGFVNLQDIRNEHRGYTFVRYSLSEEGYLTLQEVDDRWAESNLRTITDTYRFITENMHHDWLYAKDSARLRKVTR